MQDRREKRICFGPIWEGNMYPILGFTTGAIKNKKHALVCCKQGPTTGRAYIEREGESEREK